MAKELPLYKLRVRELRDWIDRLIEGEEPEALFISRGRVAPQLSRAADVGEFAGHASIKFHQPVRRAYRLTTADGRTSFHFSHRTVVRLRSGSLYDGVLLRPGAARDHCRYIERESAVASIALNFGPPASSLIADRSDTLQTYVETDDDLEPYSFHPAIAHGAGIGGEGLFSADLHIAESRAAGNGLRSLSRVDVANAGRNAEGLLHGAAGGELERSIANRDGSLRGPADCSDSVARASEGEISGRAARSVAAGHFAYIERDTAVATQPDGTAAIITNIAVSANARLSFWELVEQEESAPGPDRMTIDIDRDPAFWERVARDDRCPADLCEALRSPDPAARRKFIVSSGRDVRAFLSNISGWEGRRQRKVGEKVQDYRQSGKGLADFHDGRGGRVQYRIIGELPSELSLEGHMRLLRRFAQRFEELNMPFNLALHAPDHGNSEHQWHFHLDYYDRPCWLLTQEDVDAALGRGYKPVGAGIGEWSFAAKFRKNGKVSRPFRLEKVEERRAPDWIERLRERLAFVTNEELKREGQYPRFDPRSYDKMGIKAEPGEHLGTKLNATEGKGDVNPRSVANEAKQWAAIEHQLSDRRDAAILEIVATTAARERRLDAIALLGTERALLKSRIAELSALQRSIVDIDHETATAQQITARACSRASKIQEVNQRWLEADEAGKCDLAPRIRRERQSLQAAAERYLDRLEPLRGAAVDIISVCDEARATALAQKHALERFIDARLADAEASAARLPAWLVELDQQRPLITETRDGYRLAGAGDHAGMVATEAGQRALKTHHARQEKEIDALVATVEKDRLGLERRSGLWIFHHRDPAVMARFEVLREHPRMGSAIGRIMSLRSVSAPVEYADDRHADPALKLSSGPPPTAPVSVPVGAKPALVPKIEMHSPQRPPGPVANAAAKAERVAPADVIDPPATRIPAMPVANLGNGAAEAPPVIDREAMLRSGRIDAMAAALKGVTVDRPAAAGPEPAREPTGIKPIAPTPGSETAPSSPAFGTYPVQRIIAERITLRLGLDGQIDTRALSKKGIRIADVDRRDPRLIGRAKEQQRRAREVVEHFVAKYPSFIVKTGDLCSLSAKTKPDVRAFFEGHDDPWMQVMLRRVFDRHQAAEVARATDAAKPMPNVTVGQGTNPTSMTTLERDPAMIATAQARLREIKDAQANAAARVAAVGQHAKNVAPDESDGQADPSIPRRPGARRPPPGWDGGFGR